MAYLNTYTPILTAETAAHLLRRATFGSTKGEVASLIGMTATQAVQLLINNTLNPPAPTLPLELDETMPNAGQPFVDPTQNIPYSYDRRYWYGQYVKYWWAGLMADQANPLSVLEKLSLFWQNHFVTRFTTVEDYRYTFRYLSLIRKNALGNFRTLVTEITKDPAMLIFQNGNLNEKGKPNENYARELQELFVVGVQDFNGNPNYTEDDVKAVAKVLTGWECQNYVVTGDIDPIFTPDRHDTDNKQFSSYYGNTVITGRSGASSGNDELKDLVSMLLRHSHTPKFICRKLYRWYVNPTVTQDIEDNVIAPLATIFASSSNNFAIRPVLEILLTSDIFYDTQNRGAIIKSPADLVVGTLRYFDQPVPNMSVDYVAFRKYTNLIVTIMADMQMDLLDQPTVFGYAPYYQTGYSKNWINASTLAIRSYFMNIFIYRFLYITPTYLIGLDLIKIATDMQPGFVDIEHNPSITRLQVLDGFTKYFFPTPLAQEHKDYIVFHIMMADQSEEDWVYGWNLYRQDPSNENVKNGNRGRLELLMRYVLRMGEYNVF